MAIKSINVIFYKGRLFIPSEGITPSGMRRAIEPVYVAELEKESFVRAMQAVLEAGLPQVEEIPYSEYKKNDPILKATKARSWKALAQEGLSYSIWWLPDADEVQIILPKVDKKGRFAPLMDEDKAWRVVHFPKDTPIEELAEFIIEDIHKRMRGTSLTDKT